MKWNFFKQTLPIAVVFACACAFAQAIRVLPYNRITGKNSIFLGDIVATDGLNPKTVDALNSVRLGDVPKLGEQRVLSSAILAKAIRGNRVLRHLSFQIPHSVTVENRGFEVSEKAIRHELLNSWAQLCSDCQLTIKSLQMPAVAPNLKHSKWILEKDEQLPRGAFAQKLIFIGENGRPVIYWVNGELEIRRRVPVLTHSVWSGVRLTTDDFNFVWRDVTYATDTTPDANQLVGQQIAAVMNAGQIIWRSSLVREKAVHYGQIVRVTTGTGNWQISMQARTEQDGFVGDYVNLRNLQTNKLISGRVIAPGLVEVQ